MDIRELGEFLEGREDLGRLADPLVGLVNRALPQGPAPDALHGTWLGHPLHPMLTDLPIGFWTSAFVLDLLPVRGTGRMARTLVGLGVLSAIPTAVSGVADWSSLDEQRRPGLVHAAANTLATAMYGASWLARRRGRALRGVTWAMAGATMATVGGYLGGHLSFRLGVGVNRNASLSLPEDWRSILPEAALVEGKPAVAEIDGAPILVYAQNGRIYALVGRCSHLGAPLDEGTFDDGCVRCPWHASTFRLADGSVVHGPATSPQPAFETRVRDGRVEVRRRRPQARLSSSRTRATPSRATSGSAVIGSRSKLVHPAWT